MKQLIFTILITAGLSSIAYAYPGGSGEPNNPYQIGSAANLLASSSKQAVVRAKSATKQAASADPNALKPAIERLGQIFRSQNGKIPAKAKAHSLYSFGGAEKGQKSKMSQWARAKRPYQVFNRLDTEIHTHLNRGVVAVRPRPGKQSLTVARPGEDSKDATLRYIADNPAIFGLKPPASQLTLDRRETDKLGMTHLRFQQHYNGIPLWGRQLAAHLDHLGDLRSINCIIQPSSAETASLKSDPKPHLSADDAIDIVKAKLKAQGKPYVLTPEDIKLFGLAPPTAKLNYWQKAPLTKIELVWVVEIRPNLGEWMRFFVRDKDGQIVDSYSLIRRATAETASAKNGLGENVTINTYKIGSDYYMLDGSRSMFVGGQTDDQLLNNPQGAIVTWDLRNNDLKGDVSIYNITSTTNKWSDTTAVSAHNNMARSYEYYLNTHGRNSVDDKGGTIISLIHATEDGQPMDNAYANGWCLVFGDGKDVFYPTARGLDIIAHEITHWVGNYHANLEYKFQSGALEESFADIFACMVDRDDWFMGEDVTKTSFIPTGRLRDLSDPHNGGTSLADNGWGPANMSEYVDMTIDNDNGGVHVNATIPAHAAYLVAQAIGRPDTEKIYYLAYTQYLLKQSDFTAARLALAQAASDLFGENSAQQNAVKAAFDDVGIVQGVGKDVPDDTPIIDGDQYIVVVNNDSWGDKSIYRIPSNWDWGQLEQLSTTQVNTDSARPIAVGWYGQTIMFIDSDFAVRWLDLESGDEEIIEDTIEWSSIAISPTGRRIAITRNADENIIYVLDLEAEDPNGVTTALTLLHPTTTDGVFEDIVRFADAMVWLDDQYLIYDCFNTIDSPGEGTTDFWEVGVIDALSGQIFSVLPPQPPGVQVGNPIISPRNNSIICVDVASGDTVDLVAINLFSGESKVVFNNGGDLTHADYSVDGRSIVFTRSNVDGTMDVYQIPLEADQVTAAGPAELMGYEAQLPLWYVDGVPPSASVGFDTNSSSGDESTTTVNIPVSLSEAAINTITVDYAVTGGNATGNGVDYTLVDGQLTFNPSATTQYISLTIHDDDLVENAKTIVITLSRPVNVWFGTNTVHTYTIIDDDISVPAGVSATDGTYNDHIQVSWNSVSEAIGYEVWRSTSNSSGSASKLGDSNTSPYDDSNVTPGTTYYYWIKAKSSRTTSDFSLSDSGYASSYSISITKCTVTAGKTKGYDTILVSGEMDATADDLSDANYIEVTIDSDDMVSPCVKTFPRNATTFKNGKFKCSTTEGTSKASFALDTKTTKFSFTAKNVDLSGLGCPVTLQIKIGDSIGAAQVGEAIVNGTKPIPIKLLMGVKNSLRVDKPKFTKKSGVITQVAISGGFSDKNVNDANLLTNPLDITVGSQTFTIPAGNFEAGKSKFTCSKVNVTQGGIASATFDFNKCTFTLTIKNTNFTAAAGTAIFKMEFGDFSEGAEVSLP